MLITRKEENMLIEMINQLRERLEASLNAKEVDKSEVLKLSMELDKYIVEYMQTRVTDRRADTDRQVDRDR